MKEITVNVPLSIIVKNDELCLKYGINIWCVNEGADGNETRKISLEDAKKYGII